MPDICRLRYLGQETAMVAALGRQVEPDCLVEFPGRLIDEDGQPDDAYLIESGNPPERRLWPKSRWLDETTKKTEKPSEE